jgi:hypothetical protein
MKTKAIGILCMLGAAVMLCVQPALAQQRGHTGGLGEARIYFNVSSAENLAKAPGMNLKSPEGNRRRAFHCSARR